MDLANLKYHSFSGQSNMRGIPVPILEHNIVVFNSDNNNYNISQTTINKGQLPG